MSLFGIYLTRNSTVMIHFSLLEIDKNFVLKLMISESWRYLVCYWLCHLYGHVVIGGPLFLSVSWKSQGLYLMINFFCFISGSEVSLALNDLNDSTSYIKCSHFEQTLYQVAEQTQQLLKYLKSHWIWESSCLHCSLILLV